MAVPNTFAGQTGSIPLSELDTNFSTPITIGSTPIALGDTETVIAGITLVAPVLGTPLSGNLSACTGVSLTSGVLGILPVLNGGTGLTSVGVSGSQLLSNGTVLVSNVAPTFSAYGSVAQTVTTAVNTKIVIDTEIFDTNSNFDSVTNYRFTPTVAGYYQVNGTVRGSDSVALEGVTIFIFKNGASYILGGQLLLSAVPAGAGVSNSVSEVIYLNGSTDYVELYGRITGTGVCTFVNGSAANCCRFSASMIRGA
jgi:hypothetical protein